MWSPGKNQRAWVEWYSLKPVYIVRGGGSSISEFPMVQSFPAYMEPADLSKTLGAMLMGQLVRGGGGLGILCNTWEGV